MDYRFYIGFETKAAVTAYDKRNDQSAARAAPNSARPIAAPPRAIANAPRAHFFHLAIVNAFPSSVTISSA